MAALISMAGYRERAGFVHFERAEITRLLSLYTARVARGEWRDYAIDVRPEGAMFSIFRHAMDRPLLTVIKSPEGRRGTTWTVARAGRAAACFASLGDALAALERSPSPAAP